MNIINKMAVSISTFLVDDERSYYADNFFGFYCKTPLISGDPELMFYNNYNTCLEFIKPDKEANTLIFKEYNTDKMYKVHDEKKTAYKNDELLKQSKIVQLKNYSVTRDEDNNYTFTENHTGKVIEFGQARHRLVTERQGYFYFRKESKPKQLLRLNDHFETLASYDFEGQGVFSIKVIDQYAFYAYKGSVHYLEVFDLDKFSPVSKKIPVENTSVRAYKINGTYYIQSGYSLFVYNGDTLTKHDFGNTKVVADICAKKDYLYVVFEQDPYLYAYEAGSLNLLKKQRITLDENYPRCFFDFGSHTQCLIEPEITRHPNLVAAWCDEDFFSAEAFEVEMEAPIHTESKIAAGELFSVQLDIDASQPLEMVIRQSISMAEYEINRHGDMGLDCIELNSTTGNTFDETGKHFSPSFNGKIHICYKNSKLTKERKKQFEQAIGSLNNMYSIFNGYALGKIAPLILSVSFE